MRSFFLKILIIFILICAITVVSYGADLNELEEQKTQIQTQLDESSKNLSELDEEITENLSRIQKLDESIESNKSSLNELNNKIESLENKIKNIKNDLRLVTQKYNTQKKLLDERLVAMYESENTNYLDVVLGARNISEFISIYYLISEITSYDMDLLEIVDKEKKNIEQKNIELDVEKKQLDEQKRSQQILEIALSNTKVLRENYIQKLSDEELALQNTIDNYNMQIANIENEIKSLAKIVSFGEDYAGGSMVWPIYGHYNITSQYGMRVHPITGVYKLHTGVDISASIGTDFTAMAKGIVVKAEYNAAYGNMVVIDHGGKVQTLYAHGSEIIAKVGQEVNPGDVVLKVGSTGYSTGPHAHFEVRIDGNTQNPLDYVSIPD